ncbi:MAG TPA: CAP domain-containing protein [Jatrophihabitans sp.]|nr:CAP domain-containing protein [Jatrophihabitans sp.]
MSSPTPRAARAARRPIARLLVVLTAVVATSVSLVGVAGSASAVPARSAKERALAAAVLKVLNAERVAHHLPRLSSRARLRLSARRHNLTMARHNSLSHQLPGEADFARRISATGYRWRYAGENIGWNSVTTKRGVVALEKIMYHEKAPYDGHRQNILSRSYRNVGVDVYIDRKHHKVWLTTDFGRH